MDMDDKGKIELEKRNEDSMDHHSPTASLDWRFRVTNLSDSSMGMVPSDNLMTMYRGGLMDSSCSSASMVDSYSPIVMEHSSSQNFSFCDINAQNDTSPSSTLGIRKGDSGSLRNVLDMGWNQPNPMLRGGIFLPNAPGMFPQSHSQFPADSAFTERAARFSCFNGGSFSNMGNPFPVPQSMAPYSSVCGVTHGQQEVDTGNGLESLPGRQSQENDTNVEETSKNVSTSHEQGATEVSLLKSERRSGSLVRSLDEAKQGVGRSGDESDGAEFSSRGGQDEPDVLEADIREPSAKEIGLKKRKRSAQDIELDKTKEVTQQPDDCVKDKTEIQQKCDQNPTSVGNRTTRKQGKQGSSQASDSPKDEYIHVRARRGQATNSHSLAERVRREKISERMKYLQDLVPNCSKVTGKAVMLDEIINYVQSLQRQVEFLSMKLATVNPPLDFNVEGLLAKDILHSRIGPSTSLGFTPNVPMVYSPLHPSHTGLIQAGVLGMGSSNVPRQNSNPPMTSMLVGSREPSQIPNSWEDELHNVVKMNFGTSSSLISQDVRESQPTGQSKAEL